MGKTGILVKQFLIGLTIMSLVPSCRNEAPSESSVKAFCLERFLGNFLGGIPIPGFTLLSTAANFTLNAVAGGLKSGIAGEVSGGCAESPSTFSEQQMVQMRSAVKEGFDEQNHKDAVVLQDQIYDLFRTFVADTDQFNDFTMTKLNTVTTSTSEWWAKYDHSGTKIYHMTDFIIVSAMAMKAYQYQIYEVALNASERKTKGAADQVRSYADILATKATHAREEFEGMNQRDTVGFAKTMYLDKAEKVYSFSHDGKRGSCYRVADLSSLPKLLQGKDYLAYTTGKIDGNDIPVDSPLVLQQAFFKDLEQRTTIAGIKELLAALGQVCCYDKECFDPALKPESRINTYIEKIAHQLRRAMFDNDPDLQKYYSEQLPMFIDVANKIKSAPDDVIYVLAAGNGPGGEMNQTTETKAAGGSAANGKPYCKNNNGAGFGAEFDCGSGLLCKKDDGVNYSGESICVTGESAPTTGANEKAANGKPYCKNNGGAGFGDEFECGSGLKCKKDDGENYGEESICVIG